MHVESIFCQAWYILKDSCSVHYFSGGKIMLSLLCIHTMANGSYALLSHNILVLSYQGHSASTLYILDWFHFHYAFHFKSEVFQVKI